MSQVFFGGLCEQRDAVRSRTLYAAQRRAPDGLGWTLLFCALHALRAFSPVHVKTVHTYLMEILY